MNLGAYLNKLDVAQSALQQEWYDRFDKGIRNGQTLFADASSDKRRLYKSIFDQWVQTEELKAWYGEPEGDSLFQGTSVSSLTIPYVLERPIELTGIEELEESLASAYIDRHDRYENYVIEANLEPVNKWIAEGVYFGVVLGSKMLSQAFELTAPAQSVIFDVGGTLVDPHEITSYPQAIRKAYFEEIHKKIDCFKDVPLSQTDFEKSLVLADISKPKIQKYKGQLMLGPVFCNEIAAVMSQRVVKLIREKTSGRIAPRSLMITIYDTDTPYTYHQVAGYFGKDLAPTLPGLTLLGSSGTCDAFKWLYVYRCSLLAQKIMKSSLYSEHANRFIPFVFFGVLVERDADILLDLERLSLLRYRGDISPYLEFCYLLPKIDKQIREVDNFDLEAERAARLR